MALNTTPGDPEQDSYASLNEFNAYAATRLPAVTWFASATDAAKENALKMAARELDAYFAWTGAPTAPATQALTWPRSGMLNRNGYPLADNVSPKDLKNAQCEFALQLGASNLIADNDAEKQGIASVKAGSVAVSFQQKDLSSEEAVDVAIKKLGSDFNYLTAPGEVRRLLVPSWFEQPSIKRDLIFEAR